MDKIVLENIKAFADEKYYQRKGQHNIQHVKRVARNALNITDILGDKYKIDRNLLEAICYMHDYVIINKKHNIFLSLYNHIFEKSINRRHLQKSIGRFKLPEEEKKTFVNAIINHPYSIPYHHLNRNKDLYSKILQDADSLDYISKERLKYSRKVIKLLSPFVKFYVNLIKKEIKHFLNFPQLAQSLYIFES